MRLIDADAVLALIRPDSEEDIESAMLISDTKRMVRNIINAQPTVDAVPVVRCRDCVYCVPLDAHSGMNSWYQHCTEWHGEETKNVWHKYKKYYKDYSIVEQDGYCVFGERRTE